MKISQDTRNFIEAQINYYVNEAESYKQITSQYVPEISSIEDTTFGLITGLIYARFLQMYQNQNKTVTVEDIQEFQQILKEKAGMIKKAISHDIDSEKPDQQIKE